MDNNHRSFLFPIFIYGTPTVGSVLALLCFWGLLLQPDPALAMSEFFSSILFVTIQRIMIFLLVVTASLSLIRNLQSDRPDGQRHFFAFQCSVIAIMLIAALPYISGWLSSWLLH